VKISVDSFFDELEKIQEHTKHAAWYHRVAANAVGAGGHAAETIGLPVARRAYAKAAKLYQIDKKQLKGELHKRFGPNAQTAHPETSLHRRFEKSEGAQQDWADKASDHKRYGGQSIWATE